jgi:AraC-like DNA-binding protein
LRNQLIRKLPFEPFAIDHQIDPKRRYRLELDPQFPFAIRLFAYDQAPPPFPLNWHERLELFMPIAGCGVFAMGDVRVEFKAGDVLVIDNMKLHGLLDFRGPARRAVVVTFLPSFVYSLGSPLCDAIFLAPFFWEGGSAPPIVRSTDRLAPTLHGALTRLVACYFNPSPGIQFQAGCKAYLLEVLYILTAQFGRTEAIRSEYLKKQEQSQLLGVLHEYLLGHYSEKVPVATAAGIVNMSESKFMRYFKRATGETFLSYLTRLRLERAAQLLDETDWPIARIANEVGFADQSYFDKVFHRHFHRTPRDTRRRPPLARACSSLAVSQPRQ